MNKRKLISAIGGLRKWSKQCHAASLALVRSGLLPEGARVARGFHPKVGGQHSWAVAGDPYRGTSTIFDPTLWSYTNEKPYLLIGRAMDLPYRPHGAGSIWNYGRPTEPTGPVIELGTKLSKAAQEFLRDAAPKGLDYRGWMTLANSPVGGWPAAEIIGAMSKNKRIAAVVPVDVLGMITDQNPGNLYF